MEHTAHAAAGWAGAAGADVGGRVRRGASSACLQMDARHRHGVFAVPGAFTPTCSEKHLPGFLELADKLKAKGVDEIWCVSVNDPFVMGAWGRDQGVDGRVRMLADGSAEWTKKLGMELDLTARGLGVRSRRYSALLQDGVVKQFNAEQGGDLTVSDAGTLLGQL